MYISTKVIIRSTYYLTISIVLMTGRYVYQISRFDCVRRTCSSFYENKVCEIVSVHFMDDPFKNYNVVLYFDENIMV